MTERASLFAAGALPANVHIAVSDRSGGVSDGKYGSMNLSHMVDDDDGSVGENRLRFAGSLPGDPDLAWLSQVHGAAVLLAHEVVAAKEQPEADASWTNQAGIACVVTTADCVPVLLAANDGSRIAAIHAGWRGLAAGIIQATIDEMGSGDLSAFIGPCIGQDNYQVGAEVVDALRGDDGSDGCLRKDGIGKTLVDLAGIASARLRAGGVGTVHTANVCNYADQRNYFSARRDGKTSGRFASAIWIASPAGNGRR